MIQDASSLRLSDRFLRLCSRTIAALCGAWLLPALLTAQAAQGGGWAKGTLSVGGRTFELRHAVVVTDGALGNVYLSDVPLTTATIANFVRMGELGKSGGLHALYIKVILRHREVSGIEVWDRVFPNGSVFAWKGDLGAHELDAVAGDHVSGRARTRSPVELEGVPVTFDVEYDATPAPFEAANPVEGVVHRWPALGRALDALSAWADKVVTGPNIAISFFGLVGLILIWIFVVVPRQTARFFRFLRAERGYRPVATDDADLAAALRNLAPFLPQGGVESGREDPALHVSRAIALSLPRGTRFLTRSWCTIPRNRGARSINELLFYHHVLELRPLPFAGEVFIIGKGVGWPFYWLPKRDLALGVREIQGGGTPEFGELYSVCARVETAIPLPLQQALVDLADRLVLRHVQLGGPWLATMNLRFTPNGWGLCCEQVIGQKRLLALIDIVDRIGAALDASEESARNRGGP